jgi:PAS domain S-box-containing protein
LRQRAEATFQEKAELSLEELKAMSPEAVRQTLHELGAHQIELEMQNEELRRAQVELEASRACYFDLFDLAPVGYVTLSETRLILEANLTAVTLLNVPRTALVGRPLSRFIVKEDSNVLHLAYKQILETGEPQSCEFRMRKQDGPIFWTDVKLTAAKDADGAPVCRVVLSDITARKRAEAEKEKLEAVNRQLQKSESLGRMAGAIAHHFNNQLQAVMLNLEMAANNLPQNAGPVEGLSEAMQSARKAAGVSSQMLTYLGQSRVRHEPLDLADVCRRSLVLLRAALPRSEVWETDLPAPGPGIRANANQIQQVLTNLVTNAWEASAGGRGSIRLSVKTVAAADLPATRCFPLNYQPQEKAYACLEVADAGCGIAAKEIDKLFDPFFSTKFTGRGLGLSVVLGIARSHDGFVTVESEPGRGSTFRVYFPVSAEAVPQKPVHVSVGPISENIGPGATVLVVDDEPVVRKTLALVLRQSGFTVLEAQDGVAAVAVLQQHRNEIGCVVCDLTMPRMNGWETLAALRQLVPKIPVILASGYSEAQVMEGDHPERPQAFLHKPYESKALINAINQVLAARKPETQVRRPAPQNQ